jgi:predicted ATPase
MGESPLVTLTGPGGVGKTRIALEVAERSRRGLQDGVWIVELAGLEDASGLSQASCRPLSFRINRTATRWISSSATSKTDT